MLSATGPPHYVHNPPVRERPTGWQGRSRRSLACALLAVGLVAVQPGGAGALEVPPGYRVETALEGVRHPTTLAFAPGGRVFVAEHNGGIQVFDGITDPEPELAVDLTENVHAFWDRGLLGMKLDPDFPDSPYVYVSYTYDARPGETAPAHQQGPDGSDNCVRITGETPVEELPNDCVVSGRIARYELDPATGVAIAGALTPGEEPLVTDWCQQYPSHSMGDIEFDSEGALLGTGGDGAGAYDYGQPQWGNPCLDPPAEGGSLRSQDIRTPGDPTGFNGSIVRIDPASGEARPTNPLFDGSDVKARRIVAHGLRNPFRFEIRPGTNELYIGDVGAASFEEIDLIPNLPNGPSAGSPYNFGWPCFEGNPPEPNFKAFSESVPLPLCQSLYSSPPDNLREPFFSYPRTGPLFGDDACEAGGAAIAGLAFYELPEAPPVGALPEEIDGDLLIADAARGCLWAMGVGADGRPDPAQLQNLIVRTPADEGGFTPTDVVIGPDGALYIPDFWGDRIARLRHFAGNQPPLARIDVDRTFGAMESGEFTVSFDGSASTDEDDGELDYAWDLDGDGEFDDSASVAPPHTYTAAENVIAQLQVTDPDGAADIDRVKLFPGDEPPEPAIESPAADTEWTVGDEISFTGSATDPDDGDVPVLDWDITILHCPADCYSHSLAHFTDTAAGSVTAPDHEYPSHLMLTLTATDERGLAVKVSRALYPRVVDLTVESVPAGIPLTIDSTTLPTPFVKSLIAGGSASVTAPGKAELGGREYAFDSWSDGGPQTHLVAPTESGSLVASYVTTEGDGHKRAGSRKVRLRLSSRPRGLPLRVGRRWYRAGVTLWVAKGRRLRLASPRRVRHRGRSRVYAFKRWTHDRRRAHRIRMSRSRTYTAIFRAVNGSAAIRDGRGRR